MESHFIVAKRIHKYLKGKNVLVYGIILTFLLVLLDNLIQIL